jgi:hypothetical protein
MKGIGVLEHLAKQCMPRLMICGVFLFLLADREAAASSAASLITFASSAPE